MTEETIKALAEEKLKNHYLGIDDYGILYMSWDGLKEHHAPLVNAFTAAMCEMYKAAQKDRDQLEADLNHNIRRCLEIAEERDKALAALSGTDRIGLTENDIYSLVSRAQVAALKDDWQTPEEFTKKWLAGTERVECYLPCEFSEGEIYAGTEAGPLPLKLVTITVVPNHQS